MLKSHFLRVKAQVFGLKSKSGLKFLVVVMIIPSAYYMFFFLQYMITLNKILQLNIKKCTMKVFRYCF